MFMAETVSDLCAGEDEDKSSSCSGEAPGEECPQESLHHWTAVCKHGFT